MRGSVSERAGPSAMLRSTLIDGVGWDMAVNACDSHVLFVKNKLCMQCRTRKG